MTNGEQRTLDVALDFLKEWREEDRKWKREADRRLDVLERRNTASDAVKETISARTASREKVRNLGLGAGLSAGGAILVMIVGKVIG